jgi:hypothetical protein
MKNLSVKFWLPYVFITSDDKPLLVPSMVLSTLAVCFLATFIPALMPLWVARATNTLV